MRDCFFCCFFFLIAARLILSQGYKAGPVGFLRCVEVAVSFFICLSSSYFVSDTMLGWDRKDD